MIKASKEMETHLAFTQMPNGSFSKSYKEAGDERLNKPIKWNSWAEPHFQSLTWNEDWQAPVLSQSAEELMATLEHSAQEVVNDYGVEQL